MTNLFVGNTGNACGVCYASKRIWYNDNISYKFWHFKTPGGPGDDFDDTITKQSFHIILFV